MKKPACFIVVLFFVTVALGERDRCAPRDPAVMIEKTLLEADVVDLFLEDHPELTDAEYEMFEFLGSIFRFAARDMEDGNDPSPWINPVIKAWQDRAEKVFGFQRMLEFQEAMTEYRSALSNG